MQIVLTKVETLFPKAVFLQWDVTPDQGVTGSYTFVVQRSGSPAGPWSTVGPVLKDTVSFQDNSYTAPDSTTDEANLQGEALSIYYRVQVTDPRGTVATSDAYTLDGVSATDTKQQQRWQGLNNLQKRKFLLRRKILRDESIAFKALNGIEIRVLKRKHFGQRCPVCYDPLTRSTTRSHCDSCYGTSWVGGYYPAIITFGRINPSPVQTSLTNEGNSSVTVTQMTLLNYPKVEAGDILVEPESDRRWVIKQVAPTEIKRVVVHQRIMISEMPKSAPEYQVSID